MKNVRNDQLKKCIFMTFDEFKDLFEEITGGLSTVEEADGDIYMYDTKKAEEAKTYWNTELLQTLSDYFDVEVTSCHADNYDVVGVWICYKE